MRLLDTLNIDLTRMWTMVAMTLLLSILIAWAQPASADVLFEGYSKVMISGVHVGYAIQRYEFDSKKKEFIATHYLKTNAAGGDITESLKARSTASLKPIAYQYTALVGGQTKTIDAQVKNGMLTGSIKSGDKTEVINKKLPEGAFFASFLGYLMLQGKEGVKKGVKYGYQAIAEEDAGIYTGEAFVADEETVLGVNAFKVLNTFSGSRFVSYITPKGEIVKTMAPIQQIETNLVGNVAEATAGHSVNSNTLKMIFGTFPKGAENIMARRDNPPAVAPAASTNQAPPNQAPDAQKKKQMDTPPAAVSTDTPKKEGIPGGQGIIIKGALPQETK